jgi:hypothetical protein
MPPACNCDARDIRFDRAGILVIFTILYKEHFRWLLVLARVDITDELADPELVMSYFQLISSSG